MLDLCVCIKLGGGVISKTLICKPILYIGNISAYTFLIHQIIIRNVNLASTLFWGKELNLIIKIAVCFPLTILCSEIYILLEKSVKIKIMNRKIREGQK